MHYCGLLHLEKDKKRVSRSSLTFRPNQNPKHTEQINVTLTFNILNFCIRYILLMSFGFYPF